MGLFPFLAPSPSVGAKQEGAPSLEPLKLLSHHAGVGWCLTWWPWDFVRMLHVPGRAWLPSSVSWVPSSLLWLLCASLCSRAGLDPPAMVPNISTLACALPFSSCLAPWAARRMPRLPALPDAGRGAGGAGAAGRGC